MSGRYPLDRLVGRTRLEKKRCGQVRDKHCPALTHLSFAASPPLLTTINLKGPNPNVLSIPSTDAALPAEFLQHIVSRFQHLQFMYLQLKYLF